MPDEPRITRPLRLHLKGDWGQANLHRVCGWLAQEIGDRTHPTAEIAIWNGRGAVDNILSVQQGEVDLALATPAAFVAMAVEGKGPYQRPCPSLRSLAAIPQRDRLVVALAADLGVGSFAQIRDRRPALRLATGPDDGINHIGFAAQRLMETAGLPRSLIEAWGGGYREDERPFPCLEWLRDGEVDGVIQEAIMTPHWRAAAEARELRFLVVEEDVLRSLQATYGWPAAELPAGYLRGLGEPLRTLDFSDFLVVVRSDLADDVAHLITWCLVSTRDHLEAQYRHLPPERSPVTWPLDPMTMAETSIPLHPGARRAYEDLGVPLGSEVSAG